MAGFLGGIEITQELLAASRVGFLGLPFMGVAFTRRGPLLVQDHGFPHAIAREHLALPHWSAANEPRY